MVKHSLQQKIFKSSLIFMLIPLVLFSVFNIFTSVKKVEENYRSSLIFGMKKIGSMTETIFEDIDQASLFVMVDPDVKKFLKRQVQEGNAYESSVEMGTVYNSLNYLKNTNKSIRSIQIVGVDGMVLSNGYFPQSITEEDWHTAGSLNGQPYWAVDKEAGALYSKIETCIYQSRLLRDSDNFSETIGLVKIYLNTEALRELFLNEETDYTSYFIVDNEGNMQYSSISENGPELPQGLVPYEKLCQNQRGIFTVFDKNNKELYIVPHSPLDNGWIVYSVSEPVTVRRQLWESILWLLILVILCFVFCFIIARSISRRMCRPLEDITEHMKLLEDQHFSARVTVEGDDEISLLARQFNTMAGRIQSLIEEVYLSNIRKKELELRALQAQVNPHFLYNTLDMIYWTAKMENASETSDMISSLSCFFRQALAGEDEFTTIENEIEHLRYYIILRRQSKPFDFDLEVEDGLLAARVVKFVLQPLVENAILHGIRDLDEGKIEVKISQTEDLIRYTITDNGQGVDLSDMNLLLMRTEKNHRGFGIKNINDRIQLIYGKAYGIHYENVPEGGTRVTVVQPRKED